MSITPIDRPSPSVTKATTEPDRNPHFVTDAEAIQRLQELKSGTVKGLAEQEFWKACGRS